MTFPSARFQEVLFRGRKVPAALVACVEQPAIAALLAEHGFRWIDPDALPSLLTNEYVTADDLANPDIASNVTATDVVLAKNAWFWEDDNGNLIGYWLGDDAELPANPIIVGYDTEGQFSCEGAVSLGDLIAYKQSGEDDRYEELANECTAAGLTITVPTLRAFFKVTRAVDPNAMRNAMYYAERVKRGLSGED
jgi:hypothetical protein